MKKLLVSVLAIAGLVACTQEQTLVQQGNAPMEFAGAFVENATRAIDPSFTEDNLEAFDVWAFVTDESGTVLTNETVSKVGDNMWSYTNKQYWTPNHVYYFTAIAPSKAEGRNWEYDQNTTDTGANNFITFTNVDGTEDLIFATKEVDTNGTVLGQAMEPVKFSFNHLLSKVRFTFKNGFATDNVFIAVEDVKMVAPKSGTYAVDGEGTWTLNAATETYAFGNATDGTTVDKAGVAALEAGKLAVAANERFTIPAAATQEYTVSFTVKHYNGDVLVNTYDKVSTITGIELEKGKAYNFTAVITPENLDLTSIEFKLDDNGVNGWVEVVEADDASDIQQIINEAEGEVEIHLTGDISLDDLLAAGTLSTRADEKVNTLVIKAGKVVTLDLGGHTLTATDKVQKNYEAIRNAGTLLVKNGTIKVSAEYNNGWDRYSAVIANTVGGNLTVENVELEHLGGTDMAYGIDNLTNGKGTYAVTTIKNSTVKSTYRAVRQFLNGTEATNELYVLAGSVLEGANKSIFFHDPSKNANTGKLVVEAGAQLKGDVYLFVTAGSTEWPVEVSIASSALVDGSQVLSANVPAGLDVVEKDGNYVVEYGVEVNGNEIAVSNAGGLKWIAQQVNSGADYFAGKTVVLTADIDLKNEEWTPIGSASKDHGFMGNFDGNGFVIKNLAINNIALDSDGYAYAGLFGVTEGIDKDNQNYINNLTIENVDIETTGHIVAAAIAYPYYTALENITVKGNVSIKGGDYTAGVLSYTRRCVDAKNISIIGNAGSVIEGDQTIGGVISDIQMNGGLKANYSNFKASGLTIKGVMHVGGISGIISGQTLDGATVKNVTIECGDARKGIVAGSLGDTSTIKNVSYENVTGATRVIGATYKTCHYVGQIVDVNGVKAVVYSIADGVKAVSAEELNLKGKNANAAATWAEGLGEGWSLASIYDLDAIHAARFDLNEALAADSADNALFCETEYYVDGKYALYVSSTEAVGNDPQGEEYFANRVHLKYFNLNGYWDYNYSTFATINKSAPLKDNYFARGVYEL